jgi:hypothetical protein
LLHTLAEGERPRKPPISAGWSSPVARQAHNLKVVGSNPTPATSSKARPSGRVFVSWACFWLGRFNAARGVALISPDLCFCSDLRPHFPQLRRPEVDPLHGLIGLCGLVTLQIVNRSASDIACEFSTGRTSRLLGGTPRGKPAFSPASPLLIGHNGHGVEIKG